MTSADRSIEAWPASLLTVGRLRALLQDLPDDLPLMACVPEEDGLGATTIDVVERSPEAPSGRVAGGSRSSSCSVPGPVNPPSPASLLSPARP